MDSKKQKFRERTKDTRKSYAKNGGFSVNNREVRKKEKESHPGQVKIQAEESEQSQSWESKKKESPLQAAGDIGDSGRQGSDISKDSCGQQDISWNRSW